MNIKIIKIGGALVNNNSHREKILIYLKKILSLNEKPIVVLSAMGRGTDPYSTDGLDKMIPGPLTFTERDRLRSIGETFSVLFMAGFLRENGIDVSTCSYRELGIISQDNNKRNFDEKQILNKLKNSSVCLVPGYIISNKFGEPETLPREGSDLTACIIASGLQLKSVTLMKDIEGIYDKEKKLYHNLVSKEFLNIVEGFSTPISLQAVKYCQSKKIDMIIINSSSVEVARITMNN